MTPGSLLGPNISWEGLGKVPSLQLLLRTLSTSYYHGWMRNIPVSLSSHSDIGMREGKSQCSSHTMTVMLVAQGKTQRPFITQGRPLLRHCGFDSLLSSLISEYSVVAPRGTPPLNTPLLSLLCSFFAACISQNPVFILGRRDFFPSRYSNVILFFLRHHWI